MSKKVGIIGSGSVGIALANGFLKHGYAVTVGTRSAAKHDELKSKTGGRATIGSFEDAAKFGDIVVLAVKGTVAEPTVRSLAQSGLKGKTVVDATNPIADAPPVNGVIKFFTSLDESLMERLQRIAPDAHFVKAFNSVGNSLMVNPDFHGVKPTMFICGNNDDARGEVKAVLDQFGFETEDLGKAEAARAIEPLCILWCIPGFLQNGWTHAFKLLRK